ncbi:GATA transcription factor 17-like protein [Drosera capensis]
MVALFSSLSLSNRFPHSNDNNLGFPLNNNHHFDIFFFLLDRWINLGFPLITMSSSWTKDADVHQNPLNVAAADDDDDDSEVNEEESSSPSTRSQQRCDQSNRKLKSCVDCLTNNTPLWRGGPAGPKSLCNACGIKHHKKRRALLGLQKGRPEKPPKKKSKNTNNRHNNGTNDSSNSSSDNSSSSNNMNNDDNRKSSSSSYCDNNDTEHEEVGKGSSGLKRMSTGKVFADMLKKLNVSSWMMKKKKKLLLRGDLCEEEQAAILLIALSCGSLYC